MTAKRTASEMRHGASVLHPRATAVARSVLRGILWISFAAGTGLSSMAQMSTELEAYFKSVELSQDEIAAVKNGQSVARNLPSRIPDEIFVFGAVYIKASPESYLKFAKDFDRMRKLPEFLALGVFSSPPQLSDLEGFELDNEDIKGLKDCKPGDCEIQIPTSAIEEFSKSVNWSAPNAGSQVMQIVQKRVLQGLVAYQEKGDKVLGAYNDKKDPSVVPEHFRYMLSYAKALPKRLPDFYNYLLSYPASAPPNVESTFYWSKVKFGLKPTLRIVHTFTRRGTAPSEPAYVIAEKQLYASHYFETALDLTFCIRGSENSKPAGFYLIKAMGSEQSGLTGFKGSIVRKAAVSRSSSSLQKSLENIRKLLEQGQ